MNNWFRAVALVVLVTIFLSQASVANATSPLAIKIDAPESMVLGMRPFEITVTLTNSEANPLDYNIVVVIPRAGTDGSLYPYQNDGEIYNIIGNHTETQIYLRGSIDASKTHSLHISTYSGIWEGDYRLVEIRDVPTGNILGTHNISLTPGEGNPYGEISITDMDYDKGFKAGEYVQLIATLYSPVKVSFIMNEVTSTGCALEYLPSGATSTPNRTYAQFSYYVRISPESKTGICKISGSFYIWGHPEVTYPFMTHFRIGNVQFLPSIHN